MERTNRRRSPDRKVRDRSKSPQREVSIKEETDIIIENPNKEEKTCENCSLEWQKKNLWKMPCLSMKNGKVTFASNNSSLAVGSTAFSSIGSTPFDVWLNDKHYIITGPGFLMTSSSLIKLDDKEIKPHSQVSVIPT